MNAKQMAEKARLTDRFGETVGYFFAEETVTLEAFCEQYAKEQREMCYEAMRIAKPLTGTTILDAKQPEL